MGKRFAIVIGVAAAGVMALGAQTVLAGGPVDSDPPDLQLSGKKKQKLGKGGPGQNCLSLRGKCGQPPEAVKVKASCDEACTARAEGKLTKVKNDKLRPSERVELRPHQTGGRTLKLKLTKKTRRQAHEALDKGKNVQAKVTVEATDAAGNVATAKRTIKILPHPPGACDREGHRPHSCN
jgi:hypothetical protein